MRTKFDIPQYHQGVFFDEVRVSAPKGARRQVYLLYGEVVALGKYTKGKGGSVSGGITLSVRGGKSKEILRLLSTEYKDLANEGISPTGYPSFASEVSIGIVELMKMERCLLAFDGVAPITDTDRAEINIKMTQAAKFLEKGHKELSEWLKYVSRNAIALAKGKE